MIIENLPNKTIYRYEGQDLCLCIVSSSPCKTSSLIIDGAESGDDNFRENRAAITGLIVSCIPMRNLSRNINGTKVQIRVYGGGVSGRDESSTTVVVVQGNQGQL